MKIADFFSSAAGFWSSVFGGWVVSFALSFPIDCYQVVNGEERACGDYSACVNDLILAPKEP